MFSLHVERAPRLLLPLLDHLYLPRYKSPTAVFDVPNPNLTCGISFLLHSVNLILFTFLMDHLILDTLPHHSPCSHSHHLSLPEPFIAETHLFHKKSGRLSRSLKLLSDALDV